MVDNLYNGSYAGVVVSNNRITGQKLFNLGIGVGANVWSFNGPSPLKGPASITGNIFTGNIAFPIAINGWSGGITVRRPLLSRLCNHPSYSNPNRSLAMMSPA